MTEKKVEAIIKEVPIGARLQLIKKNGAIVDVFLASHEVSGTKEIDHGTVVVPALPPALTVRGGTRFGNFRIEVEDVLNIAVIG